MNHLDSPVKILSTFFGIGYLPLISGTYASIAGLLIFILIGNMTAGYVLVTALVLGLGFAVCTKAERVFNQKDSRRIVIDEVSGMLVALLFLPHDLKIAVLAFVIFRILDITKPYPANKLERLSGSLGVMLDDIMAGIYTNIILQLVLRLTSFKVS